VGGCCGTTPEHIKRIRDAVASVQPRHASVLVASPRADGIALAEPVPLERRSAFGGKLARGQTVAAVELLPPHGWNATELVATARAIREAQVDAISIMDSPRAQGRMGAVAAALIVAREVDIEVVAHYTCRDRNMLGMIADLLGAAAGGIRNLLIVSGDPPAMGPYPDATAVFDIDSIGLTNVVQRLNCGVDPGGSSIGAPTEFVIGVAANQGAVDLEREIRRFAFKVEAGASFAVTQPVFDAERLARFLDRVDAWRVPVIAGIRPLLDLRDAEFLANEVPGVTVPEAVVRRMRTAQASGSEAALEEGITLALEMIEAARPLVQGFHVSAPSGRVDVALRTLQDGGVRASA
jgi:homocysteine S-methyltransferase